MHPRQFAQTAPDRPAIVMAASGVSVSYCELETIAHRGAQLFRSRGIAASDTIAIWLKNCLEYFQIYWAAQRAGLYICPISSQLTAEEAAYIANDSQARLLVTHADIPAAATLVRDRAVLVPGVADIFDLGSGLDGLLSWQ